MGWCNHHLVQPPPRKRWSMVVATVAPLLLTLCWAERLPRPQIAGESSHFWLDFLMLFFHLKSKVFGWRKVRDWKAPLETHPGGFLVFGFCSTSNSQKKHRCTTGNDGRWLAGDHVPKKEYWKILRFNTMSKGWYRNAFFRWFSTDSTMGCITMEKNTIW